MFKFICQLDKIRSGFIINTVFVFNFDIIDKLDYNGS